jgi:dipeptidyl aminopeptidase/acylaminoacyl peptidase
LAFWRETGAGQHRLVIRQVVGGAEAVLAQAAAAYPLAWSGDQQIASTLGSALQVWSTDGASSTVSNPGEALDGSPAFRPEHQGEILFHRHSSREGDSIWLLDGKTGKSRVLLSGLARFRGHAWSPGGGRIYFAAEYQGQRGIWMLPLGAQVPELAGVGGTFSHSPWIPPRGPDETGLPRIYWQDESERRELSRLEFPVKNWSAVELPKPPLGAPVFSPDGRLWAALVRDAPRASIWLHPRNYALALGDLEVRTSPAWSPDGRTLIFGARRTGRAQIYAQALEGGSPRLVVGCVAEVHDPLFAPDGRWIAFLCGFELYRLAWPVTPEVAPVRVALGAWRSLEVHPGTGELVAVGFDGARSAVSLPTGQLRRLPSAASVVDAAALAPWAKGFFFGSPLGSLQRAGNWGDRFAEAIPSPVPATDTDRAVSASPDGKQVFVLSRQVEHLGLHGVRLAAR